MRIKRTLTKKVKKKQVKVPAASKPKRGFGYVPPPRLINDSYIDDKPNPMDELIGSFHKDIRDIITSNDIVKYKLEAGGMSIELASGMTVIVENIPSKHRTYSIKDSKGKFVLQPTKA